MKTLKEIKSSIEEILIDMAIHSPTPTNVFRNISNMGAVIKELVVYCERLQENNSKHFLNELYGRSLKDLEFSYADSDTIHLETRVIKYAPEELAKIFLEHDKNTYRHCPDDIKGKNCTVVPSEDGQRCVDCWSRWLTFNYIMEMRKSKWL